MVRAHYRTVKVSLADEIRWYHGPLVLNWMGVFCFWLVTGLIKVVEGSTRMVKVAMIQIDVEYGKPAQNFAQVTARLQEAKALGAQVAVLPEMWNTAYDLTHLATLADPAGQQTQRVVSQLAKQLALNVVAGSVAIKKDGRYYNTTYIFNDQGELVQTYDKAHRFGPMAEDQYLAAGHQVATYDLAGIRSASFICYDLRFPEWWRTAGRAGVDLYYLPAQWPASRIDQWEALVKARAIENQAFVVAVNRVGDDPDNHFNGHSLAVAPSGTILATGGEQAGITIVEIDPTAIVAAKALFDIQADRRPGLYQ